MLAELLKLKNLDFQVIINGLDRLKTHRVTVIEDSKTGLYFMQAEELGISSVGKTEDEALINLAKECMRETG